MLKKLFNSNIIVFKIVKIFKSIKTMKRFQTNFKTLGIKYVQNIKLFI